MTITDSNLAMVFPGQGSQSVGMLDKLFVFAPDIKTIFDNASDILGYDLWKLVMTGPKAELDQTEKTQPALLAAAYANWTLWKQHDGNKPALLAGHSLGEYSALVCSEVLSFEDGIKLVAKRGECMQSAVSVEAGAMAAIIGLDDESVEEICHDCAEGDILSPANFNAPGQVVIAGHRQAVDRAIHNAKEKGARKTVLLPVSVPSHCMLMQAAAEQFAETLDKVRFKDADIPIVQNIDAKIRTQANEIKPALLAQLYQPVRWVDMIHTIRKKCITRIIECGPGRILSGLIKRIDKNLCVHCIQDQASFRDALS